MRRLIRRWYNICFTKFRPLLLVRYPFLLDKIIVWRRFSLRFHFRDSYHRPWNIGEQQQYGTIMLIIVPKIIQEGNCIKKTLFKMIQIKNLYLPTTILLKLAIVLVNRIKQIECSALELRLSAYSLSVIYLH